MMRFLSTLRSVRNDDTEALNSEGKNAKRFSPHYYLSFLLRTVIPTEGRNLLPYEFLAGDLFAVDYRDDVDALALWNGYAGFFHIGEFL